MTPAGEPRDFAPAHPGLRSGGEARPASRSRALRVLLPGSAAILAVAGLLPHAVADPPVIPAAVRTAVERVVQFKYSPSILIGMMNADGTTYWGHGETELDGGHVPDESTIFEIGSVTKVFTASLLAEMAARGEVDIEAPIRNYLPAGVSAPTRNNKEITLAHLATHTAGFPSYPPNLISGGGGANPFAGYSVELMYELLNTYVLPRDPGALWEYSNYSVGLLGHLLSLVGGDGYEPLLRTRVIDVLGLPDTRITLDTEQRQRLASGYSGVVAVPDIDMGALAAAGSLRSTARDMLRFLAIHRGWITNDLSETLASMQDFRVSTPTAGLRMGLGWFLQTLNAGTAVWHDGATIGYRAFAGFLAGGDKAVVVLANSNFAVNNIGFHLLDPGVSLSHVRAPSTVPDETIRRYVGRYVADFNEHFDIDYERGHLVARYSQDQDWPLTLYSLTPVRFYSVAVIAVEAGFTTNAAGRAVTMNWRQSGLTTPFHRVPLPPRLQIQRGDDGVLLSVKGDGDASYVIEASTDMKTWSAIRTNTPWDAPSAPPRTEPVAFYRAVEASPD